MSAHYTAQKHEHKTRALIVGNPENFGVHLAEQLIKKSLHVSLSSKNALKKIHTLKPDFFEHISDIETLDSFSYVFFLTTGAKNSLKRFEKLIPLAIQAKAKLCLVISKHQHISKDKQRNINSLQKALGKPVISGELNGRIVHLINLYGPDITKSRKSPIGFLLHGVSNRNITIVGNDTQLLFPLNVSDAVEAVIKATFISNSIAKIYELGGEAISLLNFSYKIRTLAQKHNLPIGVKEDLKFRYEIDQQQLAASYHDLRWKPKKKLDRELEKTIDWYVSQPATTQKNQKTTFTKADSPLPRVENQPIRLPLLPKKNSIIPKTKTKQATRVQAVEIPVVKTSSPLPAQSKSDNQVKQFSLGNKKTIKKALQKPPQKKKLTSPTPKIKVKSFKLPAISFPRVRIGKIFLLSLLAVIIILSPFLITGYQVYRFYQNITVINQAIRLGDYETLSNSSNQTFIQATALENKLLPVKQAVDAIWGKQKSHNFYTLLELSTDMTEILNSAVLAFDQGNELAGLVTQQTAGNVPLVLDETRIETLKAYHQLGQIQALLEENPQLKDITFSGLGLKIQQLESDIQTYHDYLYQVYLLFEQAPELLGFDGKRTYLILLQNEAELRPTGGFIGSYALMTFQQGKLINIEVEDVYTADGQLRGYVEPPGPIRTYLGEASWFLRDVNWDPHFPTTAERATWFLEKQMSQDVDGVIGINMRVIQKLLDATGPVLVPDYDVEVNAANLFEKAEYQSEINFFPGSTQKKDFLGKLMNNLLNTIVEGDKELWLKVGRGVIDSAEEKQLLISTQDEKVNQAFFNLGWDGSQIKPDCGQNTVVKECTLDYLSINEANLGVNKTNYFVNRQINHTVDINPRGTIESSVDLILKNTSPGETWPGGRYKAYIRFFTPLGSELDEIVFNSRKISEEVIDITAERDKTVFGFLVEVDPGDTGEINVSYQHPDVLSSETLAAYSMYYQKQSGTGPDPYTLTINYPDLINVINTSHQTKQTTSQNVYSTTTTADSHFTIEFTR